MTGLCMCDREYSNIILIHISIQEREERCDVSSDMREETATLNLSSPHLVLK